jgi:hypothetical protein
MCALVGYIATGRTDLSATLIPTPTLPLTLPPSTGNPGSWAERRHSQPIHHFCRRPDLYSHLFHRAGHQQRPRSYHFQPSRLTLLSSSPHHHRLRNRHPPRVRAVRARVPSCAEHNLKDSNQDVIGVDRPKMFWPSATTLISPFLSLPLPLPPPHPKPNTKLHAMFSEVTERARVAKRSKTSCMTSRFSSPPPSPLFPKSLDMDFIRALPNRSTAKSQRSSPSSITSFRKSNLMASTSWRTPRKR